MTTEFKPYLTHLTQANDLVTTYEQTRAGFVTLALERNIRATPFVAQARALSFEAKKAENPIELVKMQNISSALITAAGISDKAANHLTDEDKTTAIKGLIENFLEPAGDKFVEELVYRFLLTRGDTLGGSMRNIGGAIAQDKFTSALLASLRNSGTEYVWLHLDSRKWFDMPDDDNNVIGNARAIHWKTLTNNRTVAFNLKVPFLGNNVDLCLLDLEPNSLSESSLKDPRSYLALGELKGGIDPAGADEHWKTASKALSRIRDGFAKLNTSTCLFFIGAAIETSMALEIWNELEAGILQDAANLNDATQVASLCSWLTSL